WNWRCSISCASACSADARLCEWEGDAEFVAVKNGTRILLAWGAYAAAAHTTRGPPAAAPPAPAPQAKRQAAWGEFQPATPPPLQKVKNERWARNPIDLFILANLEQQNLSPSPEADRRTLIRRLSFDLIGLPPSSEEVERFCADRSPRAYEKLVDALLDSP